MGNIRGKALITCQFCGKRVSRTLSKINRSKHHYCNQSCRSKALRQDISLSHVHPLLSNKEWFIDQYVTQGKSERAIAGEFNTAEKTVRDWRRRHGITVDHKHRTGPDNPKWKGGKYTNPSGYVDIRTPDGRRMSEHRYVMEQKLGRRLNHHEVVHHINGIRDDNRPENLKLVSNLENLACQNCSLQKEVRLLKWQVKKLNSEVKELRQIRFGDRI